MAFQKQNPPRSSKENRKKNENFMEDDSSAKIARNPFWIFSLRSNRDIWQQLSSCWKSVNGRFSRFVT